MLESNAKPTLPNGREIGDHDPIMLRDAAALMFPDGSVGEKSLRLQRDRGTLACSRIAGRDFTTLADMRVMMEKTRVQPKQSAVKPGSRPETEAEKARGKFALASLLAACRDLTVSAKPSGKQAKKPSDPPPKAKTRKRQLSPRVPKTGASQT